MTAVDLEGEMRQKNKELVLPGAPTNLTIAKE